MSEVLLKLQGVDKDYPILSDETGRLRLLYDLLRQRPPSRVFRALNDISLTLKAGKSLALIGENGAGKSTLLKIIAGVIPPTRGRLEVNGRVSALLELGSGFHPEYTGLENIRLSASLLGLTERAIRSKRESIIEFADIGEYIHEPIKTYSSGMIVRLGFAIATAVRPQLLITDEVLAVGDESFQKKCIDWQEQYLSDGGTLLLVSHSMYHVRKLCREALWIHHGNIRAHGPAAQVAAEYLTYHDEKFEHERKSKPYTAGGSSGLYSVTSLELRTNGRRTASSLHHHGFEQDLVVSGELYSPDGRPPAVSIGIVRDDGAPVYGVISEAEGYRPKQVNEHCYTFELTFPHLPLLPGKYSIRAHSLDPEGMRLFDTVTRDLLVEGDVEDEGICRLQHRWISSHESGRLRCLSCRDVAPST